MFEVKLIFRAVTTKLSLNLVSPCVDGVKAVCSLLTFPHLYVPYGSFQEQVQLVSAVRRSKWGGQEVKVALGLFET